MDGDFGQIVAALEADRDWRRRVRRVRRSAFVARLVAQAGRALGDVGTCFVGAPAAAWADVPTASVRHR